MQFDFVTCMVFVLLQARISAAAWLLLYVNTYHTIHHTSSHHVFHFTLKTDTTAALSQNGLARVKTRYRNLRREVF